MFTDNAETIYTRVADGAMPCYGAWPPADVQRFQRWIDRLPLRGEIGIFNRTPAAATTEWAYRHVPPPGATPSRRHGVPLQRLVDVNVRPVVCAVVVQML